jgi:hypothetical protein
MEDFIIKEHKGRKEKYYKSYCPQCGFDKGYVRKSRIDILCLKCSGEKIGSSNLGKIGPNKGKVFSNESRHKMSEAKKGKIPWNKGLIGVSEDTSIKLSLSKIGKKAHNAGQKMTLEQKVKLSCVNKGIAIEEFNGFLTPINRAERALFYEQNLHTQCFEKYNYTCDKCKQRGTSLNAHHMNSWAFFKEERFDLSNLVCLCDGCHRKFHSMYGNGKSTPNTKEQYQEFIANKNGVELDPI